MEKQNVVHRDGYNLATKLCSISKGSIGWRKPYAEMEKYLAGMTRANISRGSPVRESCTPGSKGGVPCKGCVYQPNLENYTKDSAFCVSLTDKTNIKPQNCRYVADKFVQNLVFAHL